MAADLQYLQSRIIVNAETGCWEWAGSVNRYGYGKCTIDGTTVYSHRLSYQLHVGPIPNGSVIRHSCDNRRCCNPAHLTAGTQSDNVKDMVERGRDRFPWAQKKAPSLGLES